jgi:hypothetical protein
MRQGGEWGGNSPQWLPPSRSIIAIMPGELFSEPRSAQPIVEMSNSKQKVFNCFVSSERRGVDVDLECWKLTFENFSNFAIRGEVKVQEQKQSMPSARLFTSRESHLGHVLAPIRCESDAMCAWRDHLKVGWSSDFHENRRIYF